MTELRHHTWRPNAALMAATLAALTDFARHWPRAMATAFDATEAGQQYVSDYAFALKDVDVRAIPMAARQWLAHHEMPPKPAALGALARDVAEQHFPTPRATIAPPPIETGRSDARLADLHARAAGRLGSQARVSQVWEYLLVRAGSEVARDAIRRGAVSDVVFDGAVDAIDAQCHRTEVAS